ncbi:MAG TPA: 4-(cytidine 5'-diphospho)-2-C-methyl-D-erythritol kinase [Gemmatimonadaceae bacterium]|nr:4-(cytidine 5'-diphospho)-2-C-methyl-D-erythritol kinase [Gemmatimonadaceae bacterium]
MTRLARAAAQAKINLWLRVGPPDGRGYHDIDTLFQRIDLADDVEVRALDVAERSLHWTTEERRATDLGSVEQNLAYRAGVAFQERAGWPAGFEIRLVKRIPIGGGLGGGSADAAAVLRALNALSPSPLDSRSLHEVAASLGSDVPFLASDMVRAVGTGRGDRIQPFPDALPPASLLLVVPSFGVATADAYRWIDEDRAAEAARPAAGTDAAGEVVFVRARDPWTIVDRGNDFERPVERRHPVLRKVRESLRGAGARMARLSGSGSTVFGLFERGVQEPLRDLPDDAIVIPTRTSASVVRVEVLE